MKKLKFLRPLVRFTRFYGNKKPVVLTAEEAVKVVKSGDVCVSHVVAGTPRHLINALAKRHNELRDVTFLSEHMLMQDYPIYDPKYAKSFKTRSFFFGYNERKGYKEQMDAYGESNIDYIPINLNETMRVIREMERVDVAMISISPPDRNGFTSLGVNVNFMPIVLEKAKYIIAQVNKNVPRTFGVVYHVNQFDALVYHDEPLFELKVAEATDVEKKIAENIASLIPDRACLQTGIGTIPNCVLKHLKDRKDLGVHTELMTDGIIELFEAGVITNRYKQFYPGFTTCGFVLGSKIVYDYVHDNPSVLFLPQEQINNPNNIAMNKNQIAINAAIEIDLTGQVCADSIGTRFYSGVGGQLDFIMGASRSEGGKAIIAMPSISTKGFSKIVPTLKQGAGVVTPKQNVHYVVTEYGIVNLFGKTLKERAKLLISIAHPKFREELERAAFERFGKL